MAADNRKIIKIFKGTSDIHAFTKLLNFIGKNWIDKDFLPITTQELLKYSYSNNKSKHYKTFRIKKKTGKYREICAPFPNLKRVQKCISILLDAIYETHPSATGFIIGKSIVDNAIPHVGKKYVYNIDLENFFPTIDANRIIARLKYPPFNLNETDKKFILAKSIGEICTINIKSEENEANIKNVLPQGAPSSPVLSNIICQKLDFFLSAAAKRFNCSYTRYADDITFSSDQNVFKEEGEFIKELRRIINDQNFKINSSKTRLQSHNVRQEVTGLVVNKDVNVRQKFIKELRMWLYTWETYGYAKASRFYYDKSSYQSKHFRGKGLELINVLHGKLQYLKMVKGSDNATYEKLKIRFNKLINNFPSEELVINRDPASSWPRKDHRMINLIGKIKSIRKQIALRGDSNIEKSKRYDKLYITFVQQEENGVKEEIENQEEIEEDYDLPF